MLIMENLPRIHRVFIWRIYAMCAQLHRNKMKAKLIVFGSAVTDFVHLESDLDVAFICAPEDKVRVQSALTDGFFEDTYSVIQNMDCFYLPNMAECRLKNEIESKGVLIYDSITERRL